MISLKDTNTGKEACRTPMYDPLRPIVRAVLQKEKIDKRDMDYLTQKAVALGMSSEEFRLRWESLLASKKRAGRGFLLQKRKYDEYFETDHFNQDFDEIFLTEEERNCKVMSELGFLGKILGESNDIIDNTLSMVEKVHKMKF